MKKIKYLGLASIMLMLLALVSPSLNAFASPLAATSPGLGAADGFAILAGSLISSAGYASTISGHVGLEPGTGAAIDVQCGEVSGSIYDRDGAYTGAGGGSTACLVTGPGVLTGAKNDLITAYDDLAAGANAACTTNYGAGPQDLTLVSPLGAGVYCVGAGGFQLSGNLTLAGAGVWIFRSDTTIITSPGSSVTGGGTCDVWWRAATSVTLDTTTAFVGNVLALASITLNNGASLDGRALARNGAVTMDTNTISRGPLCAGGGGGGGGGGGSSDSGSEDESVAGLPDSGGAPIRNENFRWDLIIAGGLGALVLAAGIRTYRSHLPKR